jgi:type II secretory ATPase GspE/PulE/Tfp pilus assembly ATPase PilB-like protein
MIGEIRDLETADIAVKSALTGHLVFSTLHTNSAAGILTRLINLGISPYLAAATLNIAVAQRLVRRPCPYCVKLTEPDDDSRKIIASVIEDSDIKIPEVSGCSFCGGMGYSGRIGIYEMLPVDEKIKSMIISGAGEVELQNAMKKDRNLPTLWEDGIRKVLEGATTLEEIRTESPVESAGALYHE